MRPRLILIDLALTAVVAVMLWREAVAARRWAQSGIESFASEWLADFLFFRMH